MKKPWLMSYASCLLPESVHEKILALREQNVVNFGDAGMPIAKALIAEVERLKTQSTRKAQTKKEP